MNASDEINLHQLLNVFTKRWKYLLMLGLIFTLGALIKHKYFPSYPGTGKLIIKDVRNSQLQSIIGHVAGLGPELSSTDNKSDDVTSRAEALLNIHDFYVAVIKRLLEIKYQSHNPALEAFFSSIDRPLNDPEFVHLAAARIASLINFNPIKGDILSVDVKSGNRDFTVMLVNETLREAQKQLTDRELDDLNRAENYFKLEIAGVRMKLDDIESATIKKMQRGQIFSVDVEKGENAKYIGELKKNINDTKILITNNNERINELKDKIKSEPTVSAGLSKFNENSQIKLLEDQNNELKMELKTDESYLRTFEGQKKELVPFQYEIEKMNANHDFEYKMYASLNDSLGKIGLQKTYAKNKIEILEFERFSKVHSSPSLIIMILLALALSQAIGIFSIYIFELFRPL